MIFLIQIEEQLHTYFICDLDVKDRVRGLNEYNKINLNEMRRKNMQDDGFFIFS